MGFNEKVHAYIAAKYYAYLTESFGERGKAAFIHATQYYAEQRGRRMAQRAVRDGKELTYDTFLQYGEWINTKEADKAECSIQAATQSISPDYVKHITRCPWHTQFNEMGMRDAGIEYCKHLDIAICHGFNPYLTYKVEQTLHDSDCCIHRVLNTNFAETPKGEKIKEYLKSFEYHCGHSYWAYNEVTAAIFGAQGEEVNTKVLADFTDVYGQEMADILSGYRYTNFNVC